MGTKWSLKKRLLNWPTFLTVFLFSLFPLTGNTEVIKLGLNYPKTGAYAEQGLAQVRGALMAVEEINAEGGIAGKKVELVSLNSASQVERTIKNIDTLVEQHDVAMIFGGSSSAVAIAGGKRAKKHDRIYFGTLTYSNATTREDGHTHIFRETYNAWMAAKVLSNYLAKNHANERYFYISANYTWGTSTEESIRLFTNTQDTKRHQGIRTSFPRPKSSELREALKQAKDSKATILVLVQFGKDMVTALDIANTLDIRNSMTVVVPTITLGMARLAGPFTMQGIIGSAPWTWNVPYEFKYPRGIRFVENFKQQYKAYPSSSAASAYTIAWEYKHAVERANSFDTKKVIAALEGHSYQLLKDKQTWRKFDHQSIQTAYAVRIKPRYHIIKNEYYSDFFEIIDSLPAEKSAQTFQEWKAARKKVGKPAKLE